MQFWTRSPLGLRENVHEARSPDALAESVLPLPRASCPPVNPSASSATTPRTPRLRLE